MKTVGEILKTARLARRISLKKASAATKIQLRFLKALEENNFSILPSKTSARGFLKNYAEFLEFNPKLVLAIFRRDFSQVDEKTDVVDRQKFVWRPKITLIVFFVFSFLVLIFYLGWQYFSLSKNPELELYFPEDRARIKEEKIEILGKASTDASVTINGQPVFLTQEGEFRYKMELFSGENKISVEAKSKLGRQTKLERVIFHP